MVVRNAVRASAQASSAVVLGGRWRSSGRAAQPRRSCTVPAVGRQSRRWHAIGPMQRCYADKPFSATKWGSLAAGCAGSRPGRLPGWMVVGRWGGRCWAGSFRQAAVPVCNRSGGRQVGRATSGKRPVRSVGRAAGQAGIRVGWLLGVGGQVGRAASGMQPVRYASGAAGRSGGQLPVGSRCGRQLGPAAGPIGHLRRCRAAGRRQPFRETGENRQKKVENG